MDTCTARLRLASVLRPIARQAPSAWRLTISLGKGSAAFHSLAPRLKIEAKFDQSGGVRLT